MERRFKIKPNSIFARGHANERFQTTERFITHPRQRCKGATGRPDEVLAALGLDDFARTLRRERLYYSNEPDDVATFAGYPIVTQQEITLEQAARQAKGWGKEPSVQVDKPQEIGRSISARAGDEFV